MILTATKEFKDFLAKVIEPSIIDMDKLAEASRKHVQKLVYTNMVDRFDSMIDHVFFDNVRHPNILPEALRDATEPMTQREIFELLLHSSNLDEMLDRKLREGVSNNITRNNHATKLQMLFRLCAESANAHNPIPRVNISNGDIIDRIKPQKNTKTPYSITGYADWLYARRNSIVHGSGSSRFLERDRKRLSNTHKVKIAESFKISLGSIRISKNFYSNVVSLLDANHSD